MLVEADCHKSNMNLSFTSQNSKMLGLSRQCFGTLHVHSDL